MVYWGTQDFQVAGPDSPVSIALKGNVPFKGDFYGGNGATKQKFRNCEPAEGVGIVNCVNWHKKCKRISASQCKILCDADKKFHRGVAPWKYMWTG